MAPAPPHQQQQQQQQRIYLRSEAKPHEHRSALTPTTAKQLVDAGWDVTVERDPQRIFDDGEFAAVGAKLAPHGAWPTIDRAIPILGLKELPAPGPPLPHTHIQFAHCYKNQGGWADVLDRFHQGGGTLYDLEFLEDAAGRRVAAFGWHAGFAGAALGLLALAEQAEGRRLGPQTYYPNEAALIAQVREKVAVIRRARKDGRVRALVVGALGRCGRGAIDCFEKAGLAPDDIVRWDLKETAAKPGPYPEMLDADIFLNAIYLREKIQPFLTPEFVAAAGSRRRLGCVVDVSCDTTNPFNPLPIYSVNTTFDKPTVDVPLPAAAAPAADTSTEPLTVISIDHLPTLLPREASEGFSADLLPSLLQLPYVTGANRPVQPNLPEGKGAVWKRAEALFHKHLARAQLEIANAARTKL